MNEISISTAKRIREGLGATHLVIFAISEDGQQHVATHGKTEQNAREAADAGNRLKTALLWPVDLCHSKPLERICKNCIYYKADYGTHCFNGWTGDGSKGWCQYEIQREGKSSDSKCHNFEPHA